MPTPPKPFFSPAYPPEVNKYLRLMWEGLQEPEEGLDPGIVFTPPPTGDEQMVAPPPPPEGETKVESIKF